MNEKRTVKVISRGQPDGPNGACCVVVEGAQRPRAPLGAASGCGELLGVLYVNRRKTTLQRLISLTVSERQRNN